MTRKDDRSDADRIALGLDPLQDEQLYDLDDLWRVLERLGHDSDDRIPTAVWDYVDWSCPLDDCDGGLELVDTSVRGLPANADDLDESVGRDDPELYLRLSEAQSPTAPLVACYECKSAFEASFRRLRDPEEYSLPEPRIVETDHTLHGAPRIDGTRIGVKHVMTFHEHGYTPEEITLEQYPVLSQDHVRTAIEWAEENPERLEADRQKDRDIRLNHDILQSAVDAGVEESLDNLWSVMADSKAEDGLDPVRPVASMLRNGFENADGLDIHIDTEESRVVIDVADVVVARLNDSIDASSSDEDSATGVSDVNERVETEWVEETTPFDRIQTVMKRTYEAQSVDTIADRARTTPTMARKHLRHLADVGFIEDATDSEQDETRYRRSEESAVLEQARHILSEVDPETLDERITEMQEDLQLYQERFDVASPEDAAVLETDVDREALREWRTTRRNLGVAKVALALSEAADGVYPGRGDDRDVETATAGREDWADSTPTDAGESLFGGDCNDELQ
jgi:uncharacterized protein (DUF433 family)/predicted transcriptional regulator